MSKLTYRISYYALYAMFAIILIVMGLFFFGGDATGAAVIPGVDPEMWQPAQTDALLYLMYALFGIAIAATLVAAVFQFGAALKDSPAAAIKSLLGLVLLVVVLVVAWAMGGQLTRVEEINLLPFHSVRENLQYGRNPISWDMLYNMVMFVPFGVIYCYYQKNFRVYKAVGMSCLTTFFIESAQLVLKTGVVDKIGRAHV